jgi:flagellar biosynthesis protein FlhG
VSQPLPSDPAQRKRRPHVIALGGGKGGVGKTFLSANLAAAFAEQGLRVVAVDTDLEGANLHTWLGVARPHATLADFVAGRETDAAKLLVPTPFPGLRLIAATGGNLSAAQPDARRRAELLRGLRGLDCDVVVVDCGAGVQSAVIDYFLVGDDGVLVMNPEPTSVENAYTFLRAAFYRRMQLAMLNEAVRVRIQECMDQRNERGIRSPHDLLREIEAMDSEDGRRFVSTMRGMRPLIVVNEVASAEDVRLGFSVRTVCRRHFGLEADYVGYVNRDESVRRALRERRPVVAGGERGDANVYLRRIARKLLEIARGPERAAGTRAAGGAG